MPMHTPDDQVPITADGDYVVGPSRMLATLLLIGHLSVAALLFYLDLSLVWKAAVLALLMVSIVYEIRVALRLGSSAVVALRIARGETLSIRSRDGEWRDGEVLGSTTVTAFLTVINLRVNGERRMRNVVILPDCMAGEDYRRLRVWLRWRPNAEKN